MTNQQKMKKTKNNITIYIDKMPLREIKPKKKKTNNLLINNEGAML